MEIFYFIFLILTCFSLEWCLGQGAQEWNDAKPINQRKTYVDVFKKDLLEQKWYEGEAACVREILRILQNVENSTLWADWIWDSMQLPVGQLYGSRYHFGNYDQCLNMKVAASSPPIRTQYCLLDIKLTESEPHRFSEDIDPYAPTQHYINSQTKTKQRFDIAYLGACVPDICDSESTKKFVTTLLRISHRESILFNTSLTINYCERKNTNDDKHSGSYLLLIVATLMLSPALLCTFFTTYKLEAPSKYATMVIQSFCLKNNFVNLIKEEKDDIKVLHGMRFLSSSFIVMGHIISSFMMVTTANGWDFDEELQSYGFIIMHLFAVVDTYFMMSGLLLMRNFLSNDKPVQPVKVLIKRYCRLIWMYIILTVLVYFTESSTRGPLYTKFVKPEQELCSKNVWPNLLMLGNYIEPGQMCTPVSWYIFCDFQMCAVFTICYWIYQRHRRTGCIGFVVLSILSVVVPGLAGSSILPISFEFFADIRSGLQNMPTYMQSHYRAGPYVIGVAMGYVMFKYNPKNYRKSISKKLSIVGFIIFLLLLTANMALLSKSYEYSLEDYAVLKALHRSVWALNMCLLIAICEYGTLPIVTGFLGWSIFTTLGKLTYGVYMLHCFMILVNFISIRSPLHYDFFVLLEKFMGNLTSSFFASFVFWLFIEAPLNNIVNSLLASRSKDIEHCVSNGVSRKQFTATSSGKLCPEHAQNCKKSV